MSEEHKQPIHREDTKQTVSQEHTHVHHEAIASVNSSSSHGLGLVKKNKFIFLFVILILLIAGAITVKTYKPMSQQSKVITKTIIVQSVQKRSRPTGLIYRGLTGRAVDVTTGKIVQAARIFSVADNAVYLETDLANAPQGTVINVLRYKNARYVSNDEITVPNNNTQNLLFSWKISSLLYKIRSGKWKAVVYANGILAKRFNYEINSGGKVQAVNEEPISSSDSDFNLHNVLAAVKTVQ